MSEYIPSTEEVRRAYVYETPVETPAGWDEAANEAEFNRWLEQHDAEVAKATEQRIIKRVESDDGQKIMCLECHGENIALIKGEK
jgi:hypothetical protein